MSNLPICADQDAYLRPTLATYNLDSKIDSLLKISYELDDVTSIKLVIEDSEVEIPKELIVSHKKYDFSKPYVFKRGDTYSIDIYKKIPLL